MTQPRRRPVGRGYSQEFDLLQAATSSLDASRTLEAAWNGDGGGRGGEHLDDLLTDLGEAYIEDGRVKWDPPPRLDPTYVDYLSQSVEDLNSRLRSGNLTIDGPRPPRWCMNWPPRDLFLFKQELPLLSIQPH